MAAMLSRRRAIGISAAAAGLALLPFASRGATAGEEVTWHGQALGAPATLRIHHHDREQALRLVDSVESEVRRLERIFSLYLDDSDLVGLNRQGVRLAPPAELVEVLRLSGSLWHLSEGAFDPTVQPLWLSYQNHFSRPGADPAGPSPSDLEAALAKTGFGSVHYGPDRIAFKRPGMALTLNGVAQGYITDRVVELLRAGGIASCLVDMGESRGLGLHPDGRGWRIGIADPQRPGDIVETLEIVDRAVATSSPTGFLFDPEGRFSHLLDPRSGRSPRRYESVTVIARDAATADGLSTALSLMDPDTIADVVRKHGDLQVHLLSGSGHHTVLES